MTIPTPPSPATLTILFFGGSALDDRLIEGLTHSAFSHVGLALAGTVFEEQAPGLIVETGDVAAGRLAAASASKSLTMTAQQDAAVRTFLQQEVGSHYNVAGLFTDLLAILTRGHVRLVLAAAGDYVCSGITAQVLEFLDYVLPEDAREMTPRDVATLLQPLQDGAPAV